MNNIIEQIEKIKQINSNQNLVIFVGAGVSKNSGVCSWWELVKEIADKIDENKCTSCEIRDLVCGECGKKIKLCSLEDQECKLKYNFSAEDYLRIPQHFFESFGEEKQPYYEFLEDKFCSDKYVPNIIDEIIVRLQPEHIITTNYDHLLEDVKDPTVSKYAVITKDDDILSQKGRNYIIKMHGDIDDIKNIVLKEDDYLNYSQNHVIIETFIKALLIDKTFLFVGYSLNDNNLKLIMSYIDFFVKEKRVENRQRHYLVVNEVKDTIHDILYWKNKGVELVDLSKVSDYMIKNANCMSISNNVGKKLYTFLFYLKNEGLLYTNDKMQELNNRFRKLKEDVSCFKYISYKTIIEIFKFKSICGRKTPFMTFTNKEEYNNLRILLKNKELRDLFMKAGIQGIRLKNGSKNESEIFDQESENADILYELSINNKYHELIEIIEKEEASSTKAYYCSLVKYTDGLEKIMNELKERYASVNYLELSNQKCYELAIYEFNNTCMRSLFSINSKKNTDKLNPLLDHAAARYSKAYNTIKEIANKKVDIQNMNDILLKHEEYYMKKANILKFTENEYGDLYLIRQIAYDYYLFYKKNNLMLDWFTNVTKMVTPYIKAIFCTYYPDEFQGDFQGGLPRTFACPYPINLLDVDMMVKHIKPKELKNIASHYKVDSIELSDDFDIVTLFENFCLSMKEFWHIRMTAQLGSFSFLLSLCELNQEQNSRILKAFLSLLNNPEKEVSMIADNIDAVMIYVKKHFDKDIEGYVALLETLINSDILVEQTIYWPAYLEVINVLSELTDKKIYDKWCDEFDRIQKNDRQKIFWVYIYRKILMKYDKDRWKSFIEENLNHNSDDEMFQLVYEKILRFDEKVKKYYQNKFKVYVKSNVNGITLNPDPKTDTINQLILFLLLGIIDETDIDFMKEYTYMSDYLEFIFKPESFDYAKIKISDIMWCNFLNNEYYRNRMLAHREEFWNKNEEKRIKLGFGSSFENRVAYKYLFD